MSQVFQGSNVGKKSEWMEGGLAQWRWEEGGWRPELALRRMEFLNERGPRQE